MTDIVQIYNAAFTWQQFTLGLDIYGLTQYASVPIFIVNIQYFSLEDSTLKLKIGTGTSLPREGQININMPLLLFMFRHPRSLYFCG